MKAERSPARLAAMVVLALAVVAGFAWIVATQGPLARGQVTVAQARVETLAPSLFGIGTVEARRAYAIGPTAAGRVARVLVDQGDRVQPGQVLAEMDAVDLEARMAAGQAAVEKAANAGRAAQAALAETESRERMAQASRQRYAELRRTGFVSQEAADARGHEAEAAASARGAAQASLAAARDDVTRAQAELSALARARAHLQLRSPVAGVVTARLAEPGTTLVAGQAALQVIDPSSLWIRARIDQGRAGGLAPGLEAQAVLRPRPGEAFAGRVERVDLVGDAVTEERVAHVGLAAMPADVALGDLAEVTVRLPVVERALAIPSAAVKRAATGTGVWMLKDGRTVWRPVSVGAQTLAGTAQVLAGIEPGETVVVHASRPPREGERVSVVERIARGAP